MLIEYLGLRPIKFNIGTERCTAVSVVHVGQNLSNLTKSKGIEIKMKTKRQRKQEIKRFFDRLSPQELDALLERNGINDKESKEALSYRTIKEEIEKGEI